METRVIGMIVLAGVIVQILMGFLGFVKPSMMDPITLLHAVIGISGLGTVLFMTNKSLKVAATPVTKYVMIVGSIVVLSQVATGLMLLTGMTIRTMDHALNAYLIVTLFVGHAAYAMYWQKKQQSKSA